MPLFLQSYLYIPESDRTKTTLLDGNPHRHDHIILGTILCQASLYKPPKNPKFMSYWLWNDPDFDPYDPSPSEYLVLKEMYNSVNREVERVQQNRQIVFSQHYIIGNNLMRQLGFLHQRSIQLGISSKESLFHTFLGASSIELSLLATGKQSSPKSYKPLHLPSLISNSLNTSLTEPENIMSDYDNFKLDMIEEKTKRDLELLMNYFYSLKSQ